MWWSHPKGGFENHACGSKRERSQVSFWIEHKYSPYRTSGWWLQTGRSSSPWCCPFRPSALTPAGGATQRRSEEKNTERDGVILKFRAVTQRFKRCVSRYKFATALYSTLVIHFSLIAVQTTKRSFITPSLNQHKCNLTKLLNDLCSNFLANGKDSFQKNSCL